MAATALAQAATPAGQTAETPQQRDARMQWWRDARFGMFIHWGPVSLKGTEIGWSRGGERRGQGQGKGEIPVEIYDNLYRQFDPVKFNADEWVRIAQQAGMKYLVFTTKHHDGFCNFDSKLTDYKITSPESPFRRDIVAELAKACHKAGLRLGFYYSPPDWHHPDYRTANHAKYIEYLHGQLRELCTNYGQVDIIWFDGLGGTARDWDAENLLSMIRTLQPGVIINNRAGLPADHDTPEQRIGGFQNTRPWETCMTICQQWAWKPNDLLKSNKECIQTLVRTVGGDGNLLFNVGPMPDGRIEPRQVERLDEMGKWLARYGETVYGTRGGPFKFSAIGPGSYTSTHKGSRIYLHVLDWPGSDEPLRLPPIPRKILKTSLMTGGTVKLDQQADGIRVSAPVSDRQDIDTIVVMELDGPAADVPPVAARGTSLSLNRPAKASSCYRNMEEFGADKAVDGDITTRWATDAGTSAAWLEVDLGSPQVIDSAIINQACGDRVRRFELQREVDGRWETFFKTTRIHEEQQFKFKPVTASRVRLSILEATEGPTIWEFQLGGPGKPAQPK
jgi:alpha-L-fucosidase